MQSPDHLAEAETGVDDKNAGRRQRHKSIDQLVGNNFMPQIIAGDHNQQARYSRVPNKKTERSEGIITAKGLERLHGDKSKNPGRDGFHRRVLEGDAAATAPAPPFLPDKTNEWDQFHPGQLSLAGQTQRAAGQTFAAVVAQNRDIQETADYEAKNNGK